MTAREFEILIQKYEEQALKTGKQRPITETEKIAIFQSLNSIPPEYREAFENAEAGNFSQFDSLLEVSASFAVPPESAHTYILGQMLTQAPVRENAPAV